MAHASATEDTATAPHADSSDERWRAIETRLARLERRGSAISRTLASSPYQMLLGRLRPRLWTFEQYASRRLRIPPHYALERPPENAPSIAIVTPSLDQGFSIRATIDSVLHQDYPKLDYLVQDGGSRDGTPTILESYGDRLNWRSESDTGQSNAINRGFAVVQGDIMGYLNSDDVLLPGTLAYVANAFARHPDVDVVYGHRIYIDVDGFDVGRCVLPHHDAETLKWADYIPQETMFWRRRVWDAVGPFDETFRYALDWDFILRAQSAGFRFMRLPRFLACFRVHEQQKTIDLQDVGAAEMRRLRTRELGEMPGQLEIRQAISGYILRQMAFDWMYRLGLRRY
ncbi:glycosyltransferase family 2 protein [Bradyrhizobium sp. 2TAF24]|uniref:glycosyltransferase family 2 protein n=1 Tax=Bradyrhizobium sp. 2TAF24 TaxID=3233011 RepID=UPI003F908FBB